MATKKTSVKRDAEKTKRPVGRPRKVVAKTVTKASVVKSPVTKARVAKAPVAKTPKTPIAKAPVTKAPVAKAPVAQAQAPAMPVEALRTQAQNFQAAALKMAPVADFGAFAGLGKDNLSAVIESGNILAKGLEGLNQQMLAFAGAAVQFNIEATSALFGAKTLTDMVGVQRDYAQRSLDRTMSESAKLTQLSTRVAQDAFAPLQSRVAVTIETATKSAAV